MVDDAKQTLHGDLNAQLLANLTRKRLLVRLARLDLAAGKLPCAGIVPVPTTSPEDLAISQDCSCDHINMLSLAHTSPIPSHSWLHAGKAA